MSYNIIGYGSLINPADWPDSCEKCYTIKIDGFKRKCNHKGVELDEKGVFNIKEDENNWINGILLIGINQQDWGNIVYRERGYSVTEVSKNIIKPYRERAEIPSDVKMFRGVRGSDEISSNWEYVLNCIKGANKLGEKFLIDFLKTSYVYQDGKEHSLLDYLDREDSKVEYDFS